MFRSLMIVVAFAGCASGTEQGAEPDAGVEQPDSGPIQPPSAGECAEGQHACGPVCFVRQPNEPENGCAFGCGSACPTPENGVATCTADGTCDFTCSSGLTRVGDSCVSASCGNNSCGTAPDGTTCGYCWTGISCGSDLQCDIAPDAKEWNDVYPSASYLGDLDDSDDADAWVDNLSIGETIVSGTTRLEDEDWFKFHVTDGFDGGDPVAAVELATRGSALGWLYTSHELTVWFACDNGDAGSVVRCGEWYTQRDQNSLFGVATGPGCTVNGTYLVWADISANCVGTDDSGTVTIRVSKVTPPRGDLYDLHIGVH